VKPWLAEGQRLIPHLRRDEPLSGRTTLGVGGPAEGWLEASSVSDLCLAVDHAQRCGVPWRVIGGGSNVLVPDDGLPGLSIHLAGPLSEASVDGCVVDAGAGAALAVACWRGAEAGLSGLEPFTGIPGTVGGAVVGNAGAWGASLWDVIESVSVLTPDGQAVIPAAEVGSAYRWSGMGGHLVISARLRLRPDDAGAVSDRMNDYASRRRASQPICERSAGCVFRNPEPMSAGRLLDEAGCKGMSVGGAVVSDVHANFIVTSGGARAADVLELMVRMAGAVESAFGVCLQPEVVLMGMDWHPERELTPGSASRT